MKTLSKIISEKSHLMVKFVVYQIAMSFFGLMMFMSVSALSENLMLPAGIFCILFYASILGTALWDEGANDKIRIEGGRMKKDNFLGLKICLVPYSVTILLTGFNAIYTSVIGTSNALTSVINAIVKVLLSGVYVCFDLAVFPWSETMAVSENPIRFFAYCLITLAIAFASYFMGVNGVLAKNKKK